MAIDVNKVMKREWAKRIKAEAEERAAYDMSLVHGSEKHAARVRECTIEVAEELAAFLFTYWLKNR